MKSFNQLEWPPGIPPQDQEGGDCGPDLGEEDQGGSSHETGVMGKGEEESGECGEEMEELGVQVLGHVGHGYEELEVFGRE